jgi:hypothetical protein
MKGIVMNKKLYVLSAVAIGVSALGAASASDQKPYDPEDPHNVYNAYREQGAPVFRALQAYESARNRILWDEHKKKQETQYIVDHYTKFSMQWNNEMLESTNKCLRTGLKDESIIREMVSRLIYLTNLAVLTKNNSCGRITDERLCDNLLSDLKRVSDLCDFALDKPEVNVHRPNFLPHIPIVLTILENSQKILKDEAPVLHESVAEKYNILTKRLKAELPQKN